MRLDGIVLAVIIAVGMLALVADAFWDVLGP